MEQRYKKTFFPLRPGFRVDVVVVVVGCCLGIFLVVEIVVIFQ